MSSYAKNTKSLTKGILDEELIDDIISDAAIKIGTSEENLELVRIEVGVAVDERDRYIHALIRRKQNFDEKIEINFVVVKN